MELVTIYKNGIEVESVWNGSHYQALQTYLEENGIDYTNMDSWNNDNEWYCKVENNVYSTF